MLARPDRRERAWDAALLLVWAAVGFGLLLSRESQLFWNYDGSYMFSLLTRQHAWAIPLESLSIDFYQGLGDSFIPANFRLLPETWLVDVIGDRAVAKAAIYAIHLLWLTAAVMIFGRIIGIASVTALAGALLVGAAMFPFYKFGATHPIVALSPAFTPQLATAYVLASCFLLLGRFSIVADLGLGGAMLASGFWVLLAGPLTIVMSVLFLGIVVLSGVISSRGRERWRKIGVTLAVAAILAASGAVSFMAGLILNSAPAAFTSELVNDRQTFFYTSMLFHWREYGPVGPLLAAGGILGALFSVRSEHRVLRVFAITLLTYLISRLVFGVLVIVFDFWRGPSPLYFEFFAIPLYCLFAAVLCGKVMRWTGLSRRFQATKPVHAKAGIVCAVCLAVTAVIGSAQDIAPGFSNAPKLTAVAGFLQENIGLRAGEAFRGRAATMTGRGLPRNASWLDLASDDFDLATKTGGEVRLFGLHHHDIPTLMQYGPTITPAMYAFVTRLLTEPGDTQQRSAMVLRRIDPPVLALLGVKYVVTDRLFDGDARLRLTMPVDAGRQLHVYEIVGVNLGTYSPTTSAVLADATSTLQRIAQPDFDGRREVVVAAALPSDLVPARAAHLVFEGATLRVRAESDGTSLLVLPLEFSRCLQIEKLRGRVPTLRRVNLVQTGFLFQGSVDVRLRLRHGPFVNPRCRLRDRFDLDALKIGDTPKVLTGR